MNARSITLQQAQFFLELPVREALRRAVQEARHEMFVFMAIYFEEDGGMVRIRRTFDPLRMEIAEAYSDGKMPELCRKMGLGFSAEVIGLATASNDQVAEARRCWNTVLCRLLRQSRSRYFIIVGEVPAGVIIRGQCRGVHALMALGISAVETIGRAVVMQRYQFKDTTFEPIQNLENDNGVV